MSQGARINIGAASMLLILALIFMGRALVPGGVAAPMDILYDYPPWHAYNPDVRPQSLGADIVRQQLPWRHWVQGEFAAGRFPLWASAPAGGLPLFANGQSSALYPLHLLWLLLPIGEGFGFVIALKIWLAGLGMWFLLRTLGLRPFASFLGAMGFSFSPFVVNWLPWNLSSAHILLPWLAWAIVRWQVGARVGSVAALALLTGTGVLAGHPETLFIMGISLALLLAGYSLVERTWASLLRVFDMAVGSLLGVGLGSVQLLPFMEALGLSHELAERAANPAAFSAPPAGVERILDWLLPAFWSYPPDDVLSECCSFFDQGYVGLIPLAGLLLAGWATAKKELPIKLLAPWLALGLFAALVTYDPIVGGWIRSLPGFSQSLNIRWVSILSFIVLVVGSLGWDRLWGDVSRLAPTGVPGAPWARVIAAILLAGGSLALAAYISGWVSRPLLTERVRGLPYWSPNQSYHYYWLGWAGSLALCILGVCLLGRFGFLKGRMPRRVWLTLPALFSIIDLWRITYPLIESVPTQSYYPETRYIKDVHDLIPSYERMIAQGDVLPTDTALVFGLRDWRTQDPLIPDRAYKAALLLDPDLPSRPADEYNMTLRRVDLRVAAMLGISYVASDSPGLANVVRAEDPAAPTLTRLSFKEEVGLWKLEGAPGFAYLSYNVAQARGEAQAANWMRSLTWDRVLRREAMVEVGDGSPHSSFPAQEGGAGSPGTDSPVHISSYSPGRIVIELAAREEALLVVAESYYPGWRAKIDGQSAGIARANYLSQGVFVPAGRHVVELEYHSNWLDTGAVVSLVSSGALVVMVGVNVLGLMGYRRTKKGAEDHVDRAVLS